MPLSRALLVATLALDAGAAALAFVAYYVVRFQLGLLTAPDLHPLALAAPVALTAVFWVAAHALSGLYRFERLKRADAALAGRLGRTVAFGMLVLFFVLFFDDADAGAARLTLPVYAALTWAATLGGRWLVAGAWHRLHRHGLALVPMAVVGDPVRASQAVDALAARPDLGYAPVLAVALDPVEGTSRTRVAVSHRVAASGPRAVATFEVATPDELRDVVREALRRYGAAEMLVVLSPADQRYFFALADAASRLAIPLRFVSDYRPILGAPDAADTLPLALLGSSAI